MGRKRRRSSHAVPFKMSSKEEPKELITPDLDLKVGMEEDVNTKHQQQELEQESLDEELEQESLGEKLEQELEKESLEEELEQKHIHLLQVLQELLGSGLRLVNFGFKSHG